MDRRETIKQAAVDLLAEGGAHALTHRRIDRRLGLPEGTTSNHARTRRELVRLVIDRVADIANLRPEAQPMPDTVGEAVAQLVPAFEQTVARGVDTRARRALSIDCLSDPELHELLTDAGYANVDVRPGVGRRTPDRLTVTARRTQRR